MLFYGLIFLFQATKVAHERDGLVQSVSKLLQSCVNSMYSQFVNIYRFVLTFCTVRK